MLVQIQDVNNQAVWVNPQAVSAIVIPSPLDPNNAKSQIIMGQVGFVVNESEARRLLSEVNKEL